MYIHSLYNCKQTRAKIRANIGGSWSWLQPFASNIIPFWLNIAKYNVYKLVQTDFLYPRLQWINHVIKRLVGYTACSILDVCEFQSHYCQTVFNYSLDDFNLSITKAVNNWARRKTWSCNQILRHARHSVFMNVTL